MRPRVSRLRKSGGLDAAQARSCGGKGSIRNVPCRPLLFLMTLMLYNLSLPNNRNDLLKEALTYLATVSGKLTLITPETVNHALSSGLWLRRGQQILKRAGGVIGRKGHAIGARSRGNR